MVKKKIIKLIIEAHDALTRYNPDFAPSVHDIQDYIDKKLKSNEQ